MTIKVTTANGGSDSLDFGCDQTAIVATVTGTEVSSGEGKLEFKTTTGGTSAVKATILGNGNFGIGIAPTVDLHVASGADGVAARFQRTSGGGLVDIENYNAIGGIGTADNIPFRINTNNTERVRITNGGDLKFNSGFGSVGTAYGCRAWVNFNGTSTVAISEDGNVSSITDNGTGDYTVNFAANMPDINYCVVGNCSINITGNFGHSVSTPHSAANLVGATRLSTNSAAASKNDVQFVSVSVFR